MEDIAESAADVKDAEERDLETLISDQEILGTPAQFFTSERRS